MKTIQKLDLTGKGVTYFLCVGRSSVPVGARPSTTISASMLWQQQAHSVQVIAGSQLR